MPQQVLIDTDILIDVTRSLDPVVQLPTTYYLSHGLLIPDTLIVATAITLGIPLLSKNQRDYRFIPA